MRKWLFVCVLSIAGPLPAAADPAPNVVTQWAAIVQQSIHNAGAPRSAGTSEVLHTMVHLAVYDAVVAIERGYAPYAAPISAWQGADVEAAVATAAYLTARARVAASQVAYLDQEYATYMGTIADGPAKQDGIDVGTQAAAAILQRRANDGYINVVLYQCSQIPPPTGEFEPDAGCPVGPQSPQPVDAKVGQIKPFAFAHASPFPQFRPVKMESKTYARDFIETRDYGRLDSIVRTAEQTDVAYFWSENPYVHWNRNLTGLAVAKGLDVLETARLFALVHTAVSDAVIAGFESKYRHAAWRPRTAIPNADADRNRHTAADPTWLPLLSVNHPEYPSGHGFWSTALIDAVAAFFGTTKVSWTIATSKMAVPKLEKTERSYDDLAVLKQEIFDARVWGGLHWRYSTVDGSRLGAHVAAYVTKHLFQPASARDHEDRN